MSGLLVEALKRRANDFIGLAREMMNRGKYDMAAFFSEQSCQLRIKASLLKLFGETPSIHGLRQLLGLLAKRFEEAGRNDLSQRIIDFVRRYRDVFLDLEEAYIEARYRAPEYTKIQVELMIDIAEKLSNLLEEVEKIVLG